MPDLKDTFAKLKSTVVKTQTQKIDAKLDASVKDILAYKSHGGRNGYIDLVKSLISKTTHDVQMGGGTGGDLFNQGVGPATFGQGGRLMRYKTYQAIVSNISYCFRALQVLVENILSPDDITKITLEIKPIDYIEDEIPTAARVKYIKEVLEKIGLEKHLDLIVRNTLLFGDFFCEIADPQTALTSRSILTEAQYNFLLEGTYKNGIKDKFSVTTENKDIYNIDIDYSGFMDEASKPKDDDRGLKKKLKTLKDLQLVYHEPQHVLRLQSRIFPICFGFLVFPPQDMIMGSNIADQTVNNICIAILKNLEKKIPQVKELKADKELRDIIKNMLAQTDLNKSLEIRYVPPDKMTHFLMPTTKYYPYGESIFDSTQYSSKVLIALETALAIQRLSRSTEKRKIAIEVGLPRDARKAIESMKEEFRKRKISLDSFGTVDTIPSMITTFEDVYIPQRDGKPFVDISTFTEGNVDTRSKVDEIKQMRDQLVASLGVPPAFIGIEENLSNKCLHLFTKIKLLSGKNITLKKLIKEFDETGNINNKYTYSYDNETGMIVPGKIIWAGITRKNAKVVKITLDNGKSEIVTPDHHFMLRNGEYIEAQELKSGDSLMPLYTKRTHIKSTTKRVPYQLVYHPGTDIWQETHRMVAIHEGFVESNDRLNVHHKDFNPLNNSPNNLEGLSNKNHLNKHIQHKDFITTGRGNVKEENYVKEVCVVCEKEYIRHIQNNQITCLDQECIKEIRRLNGIKSGIKREKTSLPKIKLICPFCNKKFIRNKKYIDNIKSSIITCGEKECYKKSFILYNNTEERKILASVAGKKGGNESKYKLVAYNKENGAPMKGKTKEEFPEIFERRTTTLRRNRQLNHKVVSVEFLDYIIDTGDITVEKYHNFAVSSGVIISNSALSEENILFARTIIRYQKFLSSQINDLIGKVFDIIDPEQALILLDTVKISFPVPKSLQFERESRYMNELTNLIESLERIGIPKEYAKRRYLPQFDWEQIKKYEIDDKVDKALDPSKTEDEFGMGGMAGVGGAPMPGGGF